MEMEGVVVERRARHRSWRAPQHAHGQITTRDFQRTFSPEPIRHNPLPFFGDEILQLGRERRRIPDIVATPPTYRLEDSNTPEPAPEYSLYDPNCPRRADVGCELSEENHTRTRLRLWRGHASTNNSHGTGKPMKVLEKIDGHMKEMSRVVREAPEKLWNHRAKQKLTWLKKHNYLSDQERLLTSDLRR
ncbi:hypothetical protein K504DRAFT_175118 [Pleomassaria siparia CBS 279.74]|uniref:Uncharacterized protein n=1 Tax=Pleomassaria siparia CBS 279.74 TaxID=1314801 RepID=A0A6G1JU22_9PLEO|nr:hypothetical protein K504DRAFT_175118 [Pleomassaria siparia CBS 279.74]